MVNYDDYVKLTAVPPALLFCLTVIGFLPPICFSICFCCKGRTAKRLQLYCLLEMYKVTSFVFRDAIQKRELNLDENGREVVGVNQTVVRKLHVFILFNRTISRHLIPSVFPTITVFFACFFVVFWGTFLNVKSQNTCDSDMDCFPFDADLNRSLQNEPIMNCTDFDTNENVTIICYQLVFQPVYALGLVGGLLAFTQVSIKVLGHVLVWSFQPCHEGERGYCERYCFWSDSPQRDDDDIDSFLPDDLEEEGCCSRKPCYTQYKLHVKPHYNKVQYCCCSYCYPCFKIAVRVALVLVPLVIYITVLVTYHAVPSFINNIHRYLGYQIATLPFRAMFFAYILILWYFGFLSLMFVRTLHHSKHNNYQMF